MAMMKSILAVLILSAAMAVLAMTVKSALVVQLLLAALRFATVLPAFGWIIVKFIV
jgi:hypothetical protein